MDFCRGFDPCFFRFALLNRRRDNAGAQSFGEDEHISGARSAIRQNSVRMNCTGDGISELDFFITNTVSTNDGASRFDHFREAACEDLPQNLQIFLLGKTDDGQLTERPAAHGVNITEGIDRRNLSKGERVIDDGSEKIHRLHQGELGRKFIHPGIVGGVKSDENIRVKLLWQLSKDGVQRRRT